MMPRPLALDLFCGAGGAGMGLHRAGFNVIGVDIRPQKNYPFRFVQADALKPPFDLGMFDFIWASPPCQRYSLASMSRTDFHPDNHPDLIAPVRAMLLEHPLTAIENVPMAPLRPDLILSGPSVGLHRIDRRRVFETSFFILSPGAPRLPRSTWTSGEPITITTSLSCKSHFYPRKRAGKTGRVPALEACEAMGIDHRMTAREVGEAIPPAYSEFIGRAALAALQSRSEAA